MPNCDIWQREHAPDISHSRTMARASTFDLRQRCAHPKKSAKLTTPSPAQGGFVAANKETSGSPETSVPRQSMHGKCGRMPRRRCSSSHANLFVQSARCKFQLRANSKIPVILALVASSSSVSMVLVSTRVQSVSTSGYPAKL